MNERIKELALQAGIEFTYDPTETPMRAFVECWEDEMAKFAELIVRECASVCHTHGWGMLEHGMSGHSIADDCGTLIKEHFGVEE